MSFRKRLTQIVHIQLNGSSILEVVVAMFIISMSISLTAALFSSVFASSGRYLKQRAWFQMNQWVIDTRMKHDTAPLSKDFENFSLEKTVLETNGLWLIRIDATTSQGRILMSRKFYIENE